MRTATYNVLRTVTGLSLRHACKFIAGNRYPILRRNLHRSATFFQKPSGPTGADEEKPIGHEANIIDITLSEKEQLASTIKQRAATEQTESESTDTATKSPSEEEEEAKEEDTSDEVEALRLGPKKRANFRRLSRQQPQGLPPIVLPRWFLDKNVRCYDEPDTRTNLAVESASNPILDNSEIPDVTGESGETSMFSAQFNGNSKVLEKILECSLPSNKEAKYSLNVDIYLEILSVMRAGLTLRPDSSYSEKKNIPRPITVLHCPKNGGTYFLSSILETVASKLNADLISLDAQDIAQIVGPYLDENHAWTPSSSSIALLGYATQKMAGKLEDHGQAGNVELEGDMEEDEQKLSNIFNSSANIISSKSIASVLKDVAKSGFLWPMTVDRYKPPSDRYVQLKVFSPEGNNPNMTAKPGTSQWTELKAAAVLEALVASVGAKLATPEEIASARPLIVQVQDFREIDGTLQGAELLKRLHLIIDKRWSEGRSIILVGTTSTEEEGPPLAKSEIQHAQSEGIMQGERKTIIVSPNASEDQMIVFKSDEKTRIRRMNIRHIEDMIMQLSDKNENTPLEIDIQRDLDNATIYSAGLEESVWMYATVHRIAITILGLERSLSLVDGAVFSNALNLLAGSDEAKFTWSSNEIKRGEVNDDVVVPVTIASSKMTSEKLKKIKRNATTHEAKLLSGVVMPSDITTTFSSVHVPKETVEALKTLTSLSLIRPEAFSYGVLATDKIPGLLLYGPPGTGKTLLAKAVAKESGATVLEVSGADVNDMYVGESEKNVKAIFSLARKLSPCVVFIDEADAIFSARGNDARRSQVHRDLINQFLREWDGMNELSAFIMVATNRPFDIDEAVLRRLPRRLLVDLPVEKDREAILSIHLRDEVLDESVSLSQLSRDTAYYSGSDLKNLAVATAMACIREENEVAAQHTGDEPYKFPLRRVLTMKHFLKAMEEISASISEDMSTLAAIRKFDEKYGDRKGRKRKAPGLGFGGTMDPEKDSEAGRVRKIEV